MKQRERIPDRRRVVVEPGGGVQAHPYTTHHHDDGADGSEQQYRFGIRAGRAGLALPHHQISLTG